MTVRKEMELTWQDYIRLIVPPEKKKEEEAKYNAWINGMGENGRWADGALPPWADASKLQELMLAEGDKKQRLIYLALAKLSAEERSALGY